MLVVASANFLISFFVTVLLSSSFCQNLEFTAINFAEDTNRPRCALPSGSAGVCIPITECPEVKNQILQGIRSHSDTTCGFQGTNTPLVCCVSETTKEKILPEPPVDQVVRKKIDRIADKTPETLVEDSLDYIFHDSGSTSLEPECNTILDQFEKISGDTSLDEPTVFINEKNNSQRNVTVDSVSQSEHSAPPVDHPNYQCGRPEDLSFKDLRTIYCTNELAEEYKKMGFTITPLGIDVDKLLSFRASNATHSASTSPVFSISAVGGDDARRVLAVYMAILGYTTKGKTEWLCDGVIINRNWILTAAHCIIDRDPDVIRLGEYDLGNDTVTAIEFPMDFGIKGEGIFYPKYEYPHVYHDLALLQLDREIPFHRIDLRPICLPWGDEVNRVFTGEPLTLTGWGAEEFGGRSSPILQEVNVTGFDAKSCDENYKKESNFYSQKVPHGIRSETILCAGDLKGGKDACQGDSGGPLVYLAETNDSGFKRLAYTLAGIVSTGYGCGLKEFPGIYVPINRPEYLSWIKKVAFT